MIFGMSLKTKRKSIIDFEIISINRYTFCVPLNISNKSICHWTKNVKEFSMLKA